MSNVSRRLFDAAPPLEKPASIDSELVWLTRLWRAFDRVSGFLAPYADFLARRTAVYGYDNTVDVIRAHVFALVDLTRELSFANTRVARFDIVEPVWPLRARFPDTADALVRAYAEHRVTLSQRLNARIDTDTVRMHIELGGDTVASLEVGFSHAYQNATDDGVTPKYDIVAMPCVVRDANDDNRQLFGVEDMHEWLEDMTIEMRNASAWPLAVIFRDCHMQFDKQATSPSVATTVTLDFNVAPTLIDDALLANPVVKPWFRARVDAYARHAGIAIDE